MNIKVYYFTAPWCGPCKALSPIMDEIAKEMKDVEIVKINVDEQAESAQSKNITSIPTLIIEQDGVEKERRVGAAQKSVLINLFKKYSNS